MDNLLLCLYISEDDTPGCQDGYCFEKLLVQGLTRGRLFTEGWGLVTTS